MKLAITYEKGRVFDHFGKTKIFEVYEIDGGNMLSRVLMDVGEASHGELVDLLSSWNVNVLICGGCGTGVLERCKRANITVYPGVSGFTDDRVKDFLNGCLQTDLSRVHQCSHQH